MLFKTTIEFGAVEKNTKFATLSPYIVDAEQQYIVSVLGDELYADLNSKYSADPTPALSAQYRALLDVVQAALRNLTMYIALPKINLRVSDIGVMKAVSDDYESADPGEKYFARIQYLIDGYRGLDTLFAFLDKNKEDYSLWTDSTVYTQFKKYFVNTTEEFSKHVNAISNRWLFSKMVAQMDTVELLRIKGALGADFFNELKEAFPDIDLTDEDDEEAVLINMLCKPIALYTYSDCLMDPTILELIRIVTAASADDLSNKGRASTDYKSDYAELAQAKEEEANALMAQVIEHLNKTASSSVFTTYYNSKLYKDPAKKVGNIPKYCNDSSDSSFAML